MSNSNEERKYSGHHAKMPKGVKVKGRGPKDGKKTFGRLINYMKRFRIRLIVVALLILVGSASGVAGSMFLGILIDDYIVPLTKMADPVFTGVIKALSVMAAVYFMGAMSTLFSSRIMVVVAQETLKDIRDDMFTHMQALPIKYFDTRSFGDTMSRFTNDTDTLRQLIAQTFAQLLSSVISIVAVLAAMIYLSIPLTLVILITIFLMMKLTAFMGAKAGGHFVKHQQSLGEVNGYIEEMISGQKVVKVFCHEKKAVEEFDRINGELCTNATNAHKISNMIMPVMANLGNLQYVLIAIIGGILAISGFGGGLTLGAIASFLQLTKSVAMPVNQVSQQVNAVAMALAGAERIFELMDEPEEEDNGDVTLVDADFVDGVLVETDHRTDIWAWKEVLPDGGVKLTELKGDVRFFDVDFGYDENKEILHGINLYAKPGQKVAFVGATGAGKTTITNLINRFYDIAKGEIVYDGINVNRIKKSDLRRSLGMVLQDTNLFTASVRDNIRYGRLSASDDEVIEAAKLANAHDFIMRLPEGYDTVLEGDGANLSQGQRQLLSIARAAVNDPPVMILDEATSSIDTRTESIVQQGMDKLMKGRTVFVIAHRLSTVQNSNVIMVLEDGRIIERGDHDVLVAERGKYYDLYTGAFELE